jgi:hypothetical protein
MRRSCSLVIGFVAAALYTFCPTAQATTLSTYVLVSGALGGGGGQWEIYINNSNALALTNASISSASITQTAGNADTPVIVTPLPISLGTIAANSTAYGDLIVGFGGLGLFDDQFDLNVVFNADGLTASLFFANLPPYPDLVTELPTIGPYPGTVTITSTPLPAALPLFATGLGALGLLGWRRKRKAAAIAA